ncbi:CD109 antigen-like [Bacillus rossius redtenbacheri]|uniref:CD109 antigen-like n=1 Tax=Bacillus rossius redtenbacheri TaxID=93214 RepID=UPI002FDCF8F6
MTVAASEVGALPYVSPSQQALIDRLAAEAEARRLAELADNFRELALDHMMGGVLEVRWEDEIKKDVPKPKCMAERQPEEYTEQDLRDVKEYEERVRQLMVERERYRKMLEQEFGRLVTEEQNLMAEFDKKLDSLYQLKLNIEGAVKQEQLKILRARLLSHRRAQLDAREKHLLAELARRERAAEEMRSELQRLEQALEELRATYDASLARDRQLEKSFRKNVPPDLPVLTVDQLSKAYRRHPKMHQRLQASAWMLGELSHLCLTSGRPVFLPPEAEDFLRGLDAQDAFSSAPPNVSEDAWLGFVHGRRLKVESELRVKSLGLEVAESEATVAGAQRRLAAAKEEISVLRAQLAAVRADKLHTVHNAQIQLVLEQGNVEVPITGKISDFDDAVLIDRSTVESINEVIKEKGKGKLAVMRESASVRRVILHKEWQHRELSMQVEDLRDHIHSLEAVQITREIQKYLYGKRMGLPEEKGVSLEKEIQLARKFYEKAAGDARGQLSQLDQKIQLVRRRNAELDRKVAAVNVDVSERHLRRDPGLEAREAEAVQRSRHISFARHGQPACLWELNNSPTTRHDNTAVGCLPGRDMNGMAALTALLLLALLAATTAQEPPPSMNDLNNQWPPGDLDWGRDPQSRDPQLPWDPAQNVIIREATYFVVASRMVRPGQVYRVAVLVLRAPLPLTVRASVQRNGVELSADWQDVKEGIPETLIMRVPPTSVSGTYKLRVEGTYDGSMGGVAFVNETVIAFSQRSMTIFVQTDKPVYKQGETVNFRAVPISTELRAFDGAVDVYMLDPHRHIMRRWLSRQSNFGAVSLSYQLSDQPVFGQWYIQIIAQGQVEETPFLVEEYYQTRFEVNVTMPAFFFNTDPYIYGRVMANYTSGAPVNGNLTLKATIRPLRPSFRGPGTQGYQVVEKYFNFDENYPSWFQRIRNEWDYNTIPHMKFFRGVYEFKYPIAELEQFVPSLEGMEVKVTATVGDRFLDEVAEGYSIARIFNSSIRVSFLGDSPQVFKPSMPFLCYIAVSYHDGSPLSLERLRRGTMVVRADVIAGAGGQRTIDIPDLLMSPDRDGVWEMRMDLKTQLGYDENVRAKELLNDIKSMRIVATFHDAMGGQVSARLQLLSHFSPMNHHIKVSTSTTDAKVGEYIIFHVQSNFYLEFFNFVIMSKGIVLLTGQYNMQVTVRTFAVTLSAEMAPVATVLVYHVGRYGDVVADSLTFPVNGISRNNFTVFINNKKARTGEKVEVAIYGEPGAYVGLSGLDIAFYTMQAQSQLTYDKVIMKMASFDEQTNGSHVYRWISHEGNADDIVRYPSTTFGIDANRTFEYAGLVVFSDVILPRRQDFCNLSVGLAECLNGQCYNVQRKCDGQFDCEDGTDEAGCLATNLTDVRLFRLFRFNRIQRLYENVWLWKDINIGPHGRYLFEVPVPKRPAHWVVSALSMSPSRGFGMLQKPIEYVGVLPFFMNVEMPTESRQGEQVGIRCTVFNYMTSALEATVVLAGSRDYKFVHVEMNGIVGSYNPRTSFGEHQFFVYIRAQDAAVVYLPVVPTRLGDIYVTVQVSTLIGKDVITRKLHVEADGLPQYRHQSVLLDLTSRAYVFQYMHVNITETPIIPYAEERYYIYGSNKASVTVVGDVVGSIFPTMPVNATSLLHLPMDCAEQTMFNFAANLYTVLYMRLVSQRNHTLEKQAFYHLNIGYQRAMSFYKPDGSFSLFRSDWNQSDSSVWLTAFTVQLFQQASFYEYENFIYIDPEVIASSVRWLLKHQTPQGAFYEVSWLPDRKMNESVHWTNDDIRFRNISLTAHVLITLVMVRDLTGGLGSQVSLAELNAVKWLDRNMNLLERFGEPYELAIVAYALMLSKSSTADTAFSHLAKHARIEGGLMYWGKEAVPQPPYKMENQKPFMLPRLPYKYDSSNIEATSYALLTYVARQELYTDLIVKWLNSQRLTDGGWASTQDTAVALKALIEYTQRARIRDVSSLTITVEATALPGETKTLYVNDKNRAQLQTLEIPEAWGTVKVQAKGAGYAILQMSVQYNVDIMKFQTQPPERAFDLRIRPNYHGRNQSHITYHSCQRWTNVNESIRSGMAVLDVAIPTGYIIQQQDLDAYILSRQVYNLRRARFLERKVLFYFDYLDMTDTCINFTIERWYPVANMSRYLAARVYDYYAPERFNETIYDSLPTYLLNICEVCGSSQCPYCPIYNLASSLPAPAGLLLAPLVALALRRWRSAGV